MAIDTGMRIYFADPHAPWQRGANENTNGLVRQYFPTGALLSAVTRHDLDWVASELNDRSKKTIDYATPKEQFTQPLAALASVKQTPPRVFAPKLESTILF
jgi:transposase, IS30 family